MKPFMLLAILLSFSVCFSGEVFLCKSYTTKGNPLQTQNEWNSKTDDICVLYKHDNSYVKTAKYKVSIAKRVEKYYFARFISQEIDVKKGTTWSVTYSKIEEPGDYIISIIDDKGFILGERYCVIK